MRGTAPCIARTLLCESRESRSIDPAAADDEGAGAALDETAEDEAGRVEDAATEVGVPTNVADGVVLALAALLDVVVGTNRDDVRVGVGQFLRQACEETWRASKSFKLGRANAPAARKTVRSRVECMRV